MAATSSGVLLNTILSYPNGWEGIPIADMQHAAISAGLVADAWEALEQVRFVAEGEACLHFCLRWPPKLEDYVCNSGSFFPFSHLNMP